MVLNLILQRRILFFDGYSSSETVNECLLCKVSARTLCLLESSISTEAMYVTVAQLASVDGISNPPHPPTVHLASDHVHDVSLSHTFKALSNNTQHRTPMSCIIDTGASMCFAKTSHPSIMDWSIRPLDKPIRIQQGSGSVICSKIGIFVFSNLLSLPKLCMLLLHNWRLLMVFRTLPIHLPFISHLTMFMMSPFLTPSKPSPITRNTERPCRVLSILVLQCALRKLLTPPSWTGQSVP